jgi:hypothetical protein
VDSSRPGFNSARADPTASHFIGPESIKSLAEVQDNPQFRAGRANDTPAYPGSSGCAQLLRNEGRRGPRGTPPTCEASSTGFAASSRREDDDEVGHAVAAGTPTRVLGPSASELLLSAQNAPRRPTVAPELRRSQTAR